MVEPRPPHGPTPTSSWSNPDLLMVEPRSPHDRTPICSWSDPDLLVVEPRYERHPTDIRATFDAMGRWSLFGIGTVLGVALLARCLDPTEVDVVLTTDLDCSQFGEAKIIVGTLGSLDTTTESATVDVCTGGASPYSLGDVVLTPAANSQGTFALEVIAAQKGTVLAGCSPSASRAPPTRRASKAFAKTRLSPTRRNATATAATRGLWEEATAGRRPTAD